MLCCVSVLYVLSFKILFSFARNTEAGDKSECGAELPAQKSPRWRTKIDIPRTYSRGGSSGSGSAGGATCGAQEAHEGGAGARGTKQTC